LVQPVAIVAEGDAASGALYVADAGTDGILALTKEGQFLYQIRADGNSLSGLSALVLEEGSRTLYLLAGGRLYAVALPLLPEQSESPE
jgi:hypothetical protein